MSANNEESALSSILSTFSLTSKNNKEEGRFEKLASLKKILQKELNKSITVPECDAVLLAGALLLNDSNAVKEQARLVTDINIRLWGNAVDPLSKWITQHSILPEVRNMNKFIEGNSPLHFAVLTGNFENIAFLLSKQADPFLKNAHGNKPLELCQDYHRKLHSKSAKKRKRHSLKKRQKKKSHKRSTEDEELKTTDCVQTHKGNDKPIGTQRSATERSNSYDNDADDENESDFYYNENENEEDNESTASSSSSITSQSPMHLSCREFDELFTNAMQGPSKARAIDSPNKAQKKVPQTPVKTDNTKKKMVNKSKKNHNKPKPKSKPMRRGNNNNRTNANKSNNNHKHHGKHVHKHGGYHGKARYKNKRRNGGKAKRNQNNKKNNNKKNTNRNKTQHASTVTQHKPTLHKGDSISTSSSSLSSTTHSQSSSTSSSSDSDHDNSCSITDSTLDSDDTDDLSGSEDTHSEYTSSVTLSDSDSSSNLSSASISALRNNVQIDLMPKHEIAVPASEEDGTSVHNTECVVSSDYLSSSDDEIHITSASESSSTMDSVISLSASSESSASDGCKDNEDDADGQGGGEDGQAIKLLQETMQQNKATRKEDSNKDTTRENDLHSQLVPIIIALSEMNIFAESASLARVVKFICTLIFFVALHWLEGNSAAKMIVKVGVSIIYLVAMFGHRINEWKECIDAETVLRKQQWTKQRDKERQKRKDRLQKTLRSPDSKRCVAKKQRKLERDTFYKQDIFDWRSRIRVMINHAESAFLQSKYGMAEIYFSRLLGFLMENDTNPHIFLNDRKRANLKINRRWKGVFDDHYSIPIAKMFSRRAYCLCKIKDGEYPHSAPNNNSIYKTIPGHLELAVNDLNIAIALREISPLYQSFIKLNTSKQVKDDAWTGIHKKLDRLLLIIASQLCDLVSLAVLHDFDDQFEKAYSNTLQADDVIHNLNKFNTQYVTNGQITHSKKNTQGEPGAMDTKQGDTDGVDNNKELESKRILDTIQDIQDSKPHEGHLSYSNLLDGNGNFKLCLMDLVPLKEIESFVQRKKVKLEMVEENQIEDDPIQRSKSMISLYSGEIDDHELDNLLKYPLRPSMDLSGYEQVMGMDKCAVDIQSIMDQQLKKIRLLRLQAANRQRAVSLKSEREKTKHNQFNDRNIIKQLKKKENKKSKNNQKHKIEKLKKEKAEKEKAIHHDKDDVDTPSTSTSTTSTSTPTSESSTATTSIMEYGASFSVIQSDKEDEDDTSMTIKDTKNAANNNNKCRRKGNGRSKIKHNKLKKGRNKNTKKKQKKNGIKTTNPNKSKKKSIEHDENESISSESTSKASIDTDEEDSLSILSASTSHTSSESLKINTKTPKHHANKGKKSKSPPHQSLDHSPLHMHQRSRTNRRSPKNKMYRKKSTPQDHKNNDSDEPRHHWLWNINCDFWPNCRNSRQCAFKHPTDKGSVIRRRRTTPRSGDVIGKPIMCRFGRDCSRIDCWFWHPGDDETFVSPDPHAHQRDNQSISSANTNNTDSVIATNADYEQMDAKIAFDAHNPQPPPQVQPGEVPSPLDDHDNTAVIITKKPITNPWHKQPIHKVLQDKGNAAPGKVLSPTTFNKKILSQHDSSLRGNSTPTNNNEFDMSDVHQKASSSSKSGRLRHRSTSNPVAPRHQKVPTYITPSGQKIKSSLNPHASAFDAIHDSHHRHRRSHYNPSQSQSSVESSKNGSNPLLCVAPVRPPMRSSQPTLMGTHITSPHTVYANDAYNPNSYPYDEYKQAPNNANDNARYYDYGDESKVVEGRQDEGATASPRNTTTTNNQKKKKKVKQGASKPWICPSCSFLNEIGTTACDLCSSLPPADKMKENTSEEEGSPSMDFDFNIDDIMNNVTTSNNNNNNSSNQEDGDDESIPRNISFNTLFFGNTRRESSSDPQQIQRNAMRFNVGEAVIHDDGSTNAIQGVIAEISTESSYPIRIEYYTMQFNKRVAQFLWVRPSELVKASTAMTTAHQYDDDLYDYDDVDDDDD
eukprot:34328_1